MTIRWQQHVKHAFRYSKRSTTCKFSNAIRKYGVASFEHEILACRIYIKDVATTLEKLFISYFKSYEDGYNMTTGGDGAPGFAPTKQQCIENSIRTKKSMSDPELRAHLSEMKKGRMNPCWGKSFPSELYPQKGMRGKQHLTKTVEKITMSQPNKRAVSCFLSQKFVADFESLGNAVVWLNQQGFLKAAKGNILKACQKKIKKAYTYTWVYK
jgi:hypothetical protein